MKVGMTTVTVNYPNTEGSTFDADYYLNIHLPLVQEKLKPALRGLMMESGIAGGAPGTDAANTCITTMYFDTVEDFQNSFGPHAEEILSDIPNFTNSEPVIQINSIALIAAG